MILAHATPTPTSIPTPTPSPHPFTHLHPRHTWCMAYTHTGKYAWPCGVRLVSHWEVQEMLHVLCLWQRDMDTDTNMFSFQLNFSLIYALFILIISLFFLTTYSLLLANTLHTPVFIPCHLTYVFSQSSFSLLFVLASPNALHNITLPSASPWTLCPIWRLKGKRKKNGEGRVVQRETLVISPKVRVDSYTSFSVASFWETRSLWSIFTVSRDLLVFDFSLKVTSPDS